MKCKNCLQAMLAFLMIMCVTFSSVSFSFAEESAVQVRGIEYNYGFKYVYYSDGTAEVSGTGVWQGSLFDFSKYWVKHVILMEGITGIGANSFSIENGGYYDLESITLPNSLREIDAEAFAGAQIQEIDIPDGVTSIGMGAFSGCRQLKKVQLPSGLKKVESGVFSHCSELEEISIPESVTEIGAIAFSDCSKLNNITIPQGVTTLGEAAFASCPLSNIVLPKGVTKIAPRTFSGAAIKSLDIPNSVREIGDGAFRYCNQVTEVTIPESVIEIGAEAFEGCDQLSEVAISEGVTKIGRKAFADCPELAKLELPASVQSVGKDVCDASAKIIFNSADVKFEDTPYWSTADVVVNLPNCDSYPIGTKGKFTIANSFQVNIAPTVTRIESHAFYGMESQLKSITIPDTVTYIAPQAFAGCTKLEKITLGSGVTNLSPYAFAGCTALSNITVSASNKVYDSRNNCNAVVETATNKLVAGCKNTVIASNVTTIGEGAFAGMKLKNASLPAQLKTIEAFAFWDCSLESVKIPASVTEIGGEAFGYCVTDGLPKKVHGFKIYGSNTVAEKYANDNRFTYVNQSNLAAQKVNKIQSEDLSESVDQNTVQSEENAETVSKNTTPTVKVVSAKAIKKKKQIINLSVDKNVKKVSYKLAKTQKKGKKYVKVSKKGKVTFKKGTPKGTYTVKITTTDENGKKTVQLVELQVK